MALARKHNVHPIPFLIVWVVTLALFPLAIWWVGRGLYEEIGAGEIMLRTLVAWVLYQAPSLYILVFGRNLPWQATVMVVGGILLLSAWRFGVQGVACSVIVLAVVVFVKHIYLRRKEGYHANL